MKVLAGGEFQGGELNLGHNVIRDYFAQDQAQELNGEQSVYEEILADAPFDMVPQLRDILGAFLFSGDDIHKKVSVLSGGERNRLALAKMLLRPSNLLLMDEPTNHLDLFSKEVLLGALAAFSGTVVFVSHDRHFIDGLATRVVEVGDGKVSSFMGDYEYYLAKKSEAAPLAEQANQAPPTADQRPATVSKEDRLRQREEEKQRQREEKGRQKRLTELETEIEKTENVLAGLEERMAAPESFADHGTARRMGEEHETLTSRIAALYAEWEGLQS